jgi:hypothetical protein
MNADKMTDKAVLDENNMINRNVFFLTVSGNGKYGTPPPVFNIKSARKRAHEWRKRGGHFKLLQRVFFPVTILRERTPPVQDRQRADANNTRTTI